MSQLLTTRQISTYVATFQTEQLRHKNSNNGNESETAENGTISTRGRPVACTKQETSEITPVAVELFTVEMTLWPTISRKPLRRLVGMMSRGRL